MFAVMAPWCSRGPEGPGRCALIAPSRPSARWQPRRRAWKTASTRLSASTSRAANESKGTPSSATGSTMSASSADGERDSSVIRMTLAPRALAMRRPPPWRPVRAGAGRTRSPPSRRPARRYLPDVGTERLVGVVHVGDQLVQLHRQHAGDQPGEVAAGDDDVLRAAGQQGHGPLDLARRHGVRQPRHQPGRAARRRAAKTLSSGEPPGRVPRGAGPAQRARRSSTG